jgi:hypothetical protein
MITIERPNTVKSSGIQNAISFGIKQDGLAHIFSVLRCQLYSDKILAVIREYACNAVDANVEAGKSSLPIKVTLPTRFNPIFKVRDFGLGLSDKDIQEIYAFYGESTKRKSNAMIGQLGLGSKSAFAYGDNFVITSFVDGKKTTYNAFIDASQIGQIAKLTTEDTDEENGVEISVAVKDHDVQSFHDKAHGLFKYFKVKPQVSGATFDYPPEKPVFSGKDWRILGKGNNTIAVMGNIGYPLDNHWYDNADVSAVINAGVTIDFEIGDLEISASREKLQYTDRTKQAIKSKLLEIKNIVAKELNNKFANCATFFDAAKLYGQVMDYGSTLYSLRALVSSSITYAGTPVNSSHISVDAYSTDYNVREYSMSYRGNKVKSRVSSHIDCRGDVVVIDNDLNLNAGIINRVYQLVSSGKKVYVLSYGGDAAIKAKVFADTKLVAANFTLLSSLPKISLGNGGTYTKNSKHSSKEFIYDTAKAASLGYYAKKSDFWLMEEVDVENDSGVYVIIDQFCYQDQKGRFERPCSMIDILNKLKAFGINISKVYGFKAKHKDALEANTKMVKLFDYIAAELEKYFVKNNISQKVANRLEYDAAEGKDNWVAFIEKYAGEANSKTLAARTSAIFSRMKNDKDKKILDAAVAWKEFFSKSVKPEHNLVTMLQKLRETYPMLDVVDPWTADKKNKAMIEYFNLVDG